MKRLNNIGDNNKDQLEEIEDQGKRQLDMINKEGKKQLEAIEKEDEQLKKIKNKKICLQKILRWKKNQARLCCC